MSTGQSANFAKCILTCRRHGPSAEGIQRRFAGGHGSLAVIVCASRSACCTGCGQQLCSACTQPEPDATKTSLGPWYRRRPSTPPLCTRSRSNRPHGSGQDPRRLLHWHINTMTSKPGYRSSSRPSRWRYQALTACLGSEVAVPWFFFIFFLLLKVATSPYAISGLEKNA